MHAHTASRQAHTVERRCFTIPLFLEAYCVSRTNTYAEIRAGRLVARRVGGRTVITKEDAEAWLSALPRLRTGDDI